MNSLEARRQVRDALFGILYERRRLALCLQHQKDWKLRHVSSRSYGVADSDGIIYHQNVSAIDKFWLDLQGE